MSSHSVGVGARREVYSCTVTNNSNDSIGVEVIYGGWAYKQAANADIPAGGTFRAEDRIENHGSYQARIEIVAIEVTRSNGETQKLTAPFDGVNGIEPDWSFVIDDSQIQSVNNNNK